MGSSSSPARLMPIATSTQTAIMTSSPRASSLPSPNLHLHLDRDQDDRTTASEDLEEAIRKQTSVNHNNNNNNYFTETLHKQALGTSAESPQPELQLPKFVPILEEPFYRGISVTRAQQWRQDPDEDYKMSSPTRGYCLIINNVEFSLNLFEHRKGSDKDAHRFKEIFKQLGFEVDCKRNASAEKMKNAFKQKSTLCSSKHDALVVILLSHGSESGVYGSDGIEVDMNDILSYFDNKKCKPMRGKPKVFIVQACRGRRADYGVQHESQMFFSQLETQATSLMPSQLTQLNNSQIHRLPRWAEVDKNFHPTRTDMVLCFASHSGFVSTRDEEEGSWLGASLAYHLSRESYRRHLLEIFNMVSRDVRQRRSTEGHKQVLEITTIGFDKNLYFNPGLSLDKNPLEGCAARSTNNDLR